METTNWSSLVQRTAFQEAVVPTRGRLALPGPMPVERKGEEGVEGEEGGRGGREGGSGGRERRERREGEDER